LAQKSCWLTFQFVPAGLFKYFSTDPDKLERFTDGQVYLTPPKYFNDPWDFLLRSEPLTEEQINREIPSLPHNDVQEFLTQVNSSDSLAEEAHDQQDGLSGIIGLVCLTERPLDRLMWAHYGESHSGFVAEFWHSDEGKSEAGFQLCASPFGAAVKVDYQGPQALKRDRSNMEATVLTKHLDWQYEQEWRVIEALKNGDPHPTRPGFVMVRFKPANLVRVILGLRVCTNVQVRLKQMLSHKQFEHVRTEQVYMDPGSRELSSRHLSW